MPDLGFAAVQHDEVCDEFNLWCFGGFRDTLRRPARVG